MLSQNHTNDEDDEEDSPPYTLKRFENTLSDHQGQSSIQTSQTCGCLSPRPE